jgi:hypothetical protein
VRFAAFAAHGHDIVEHLTVAAGQEGTPVDHHVNLISTSGDRLPHVSQPGGQRRPAGGERGGDARDGNLRPPQLADGPGDQVRVQADRRDARAVWIGWVRPSRLCA